MRSQLVLHLSKTLAIVALLGAFVGCESNPEASVDSDSLAVSRCRVGFADCDGLKKTGCETQIASDVSNCGSCGHVCPTRNHATSSCSSGTCRFTCNTGFANCNGNASDGCEVNTRTSEANCGACGNACALAHATATCQSGACEIAGCVAGFGDCDGAASTGCEQGLAVALSNSPSIYNDGALGPGPDVPPGFTRVAAITHCGACGVNCDDGSPVTTDLCVPNGVGAECRHYDRAQCSAARCSGALPPGTPPPIEPAAAGSDLDGDGLSDAWETAQINPYTSIANAAAGVDLNCNGLISDADGDLIWHESPSPSAPDIYLKYAYMAQPGSGIPCASDGGCTSFPNERCIDSICKHTHAPFPLAVTQVLEAFARRGINLHIDAPHELAEASPIYFPEAAGLCSGVNFYSNEIKGTDSAPSPSFDRRRLVGYHYMVFAHDSCTTDSLDQGETAEVLGNDSIISMGSFSYGNSGSANVTQRRRETAGTMLHVLGHNLGLRHGGNDDNPFKPNYVSSMNPMFQLPGIWRANMPGCVPGNPFNNPPGCALDSSVPRIDFSGEELPALDETSLTETAGVGSMISPLNQDMTQFWDNGGHSGSTGFVFAPVSGPVDWNGNGIVDDADVLVDLDGDGVYRVLPGHDDWANLKFAFQCTPQFAD